MKQQKKWLFHLNPISYLHGEGAIRRVFIRKTEESDSQGEGPRKILYQAYHMLKSQIYSNVDMSKFTCLSCFPARKKTLQMSRQTCNRFANLGHPTQTWIIMGLWVWHAAVPLVRSIGPRSSFFKVLTRKKLLKVLPKFAHLALFVCQSLAEFMFLLEHSYHKNTKTYRHMTF